LKVGGHIADSATERDPRLQAKSLGLLLPAPLLRATAQEQQVGVGGAARHLSPGIEQEIAVLLGHHPRRIADDGATVET